MSLELRPTAELTHGTGRWTPLSDIASAGRRLAFLFCSAWQPDVPCVLATASCADEAPAVTATSCVCLVDGSVSVSKAGKHGHAKCFVTVRRVGTGQRRDVVLPSHTLVFLLEPTRSDADVFEVHREREELLVLRHDDAREAAVSVAAPELLDALAARCAADDTPVVEVLHFAVGGDFRYEVAVKVSLIDSNGADARPAEPVTERI